MKKRKILSLFLSLCLLIGLLPTVALAEDQKENEAGVRITEESYNSTENILTVNVQIKMPDVSGITSVGTLLSYDSSKLTLMHSTKDKTYTPASPAMDADPAVNIKLVDQIEKEYNTDGGVKLYGDTSRAGLFVALGSTKGPSDDQKTTDWLTIYQLRFKVNGIAANVLNSDSLRIADPAKDNDVIKGAYAANDYYTVSVNSYGSKWFKYGKMTGNAEPDLTGDHWAIPAANVTATYPGSDKTPPLPTYSGTIAAPTVKTNKGGTVELNPVTPSAGGAVQYGYSKTNDGKNITWQGDTTFSGLNVGDTLYFYAKVVGTTEYQELVSAASAAVTVAAKPAASVGTAPAAKTGLTYNGNDQALVSDGTATGGTMQYSLNGTDWSDTAPMGKDAGDYTVYYKVKGDSGYSDSTVASVSVTIEPKSINDSSVTIDSIPDQTYTGNAIEPPLVVKDGTTVLEKDKDYTVSYPYNHTDAAFTSLQVDGIGNYTGWRGKSFNIERAKQVLTVPGSANVAFNKTLDLNSICSSNTHGATLTFAKVTTSSLPIGTTFNESTGIVTAGNNTGSFIVTVNSAAVTNYKAALPKQITVYVVATPAASVTAAPTAKTGLTYNGNDQALVSDGTANGGTMQYSLDGTNWTDTVPKGKNAGDYTVYYKVEGDSDHTDYTPTSNTVSVSIAQKEVTVAPGTYKVSKEYDGTTAAGTGRGALSVTGIVDSGARVKATPVAYTSPDVGGQSTMDVTINLDGTGNGNYKIKGGAATISVPCEITAKEVKLTGGINATDRSYVKDNKTVSLTKGGTLTFTGLVGSEMLDVNIPATGTMDNANVGTGKNVTYSGVTLKDGTGKASNYKLVGLPTVTVDITKATAPALADIPVSQKFTTTTGEKAIGAVMPADAGTLTYAKGTESKTGSVTVTSWNVDTTGKVTYTLSGGAAGDTVTLPVTIKSTNYADATVKVVITLTDKDVPVVTANDITVDYTGEAVPASRITGTAIFNGQTVEGSWSFKNGATFATVADSNNSVTVVFTPTDTVNYASVEATIKVTINKAKPTGAPGYTAITAEGKTLADAGLNVGTITPAGTIKWVDDTGADLPATTTTVEANKSYGWVFTPTDTDNYETLTGSIQLWHKSTGGRYYYSSSNSSGTATITAVLTAKDAKSATDYTSGIYGLTFRSTADFSGFKGVKVDGKTIGKDNYVAESNNGSIEVYLKAAYLKTLAVGRHTLTIMATGGNASIDFTIGGVNTAPKTFDAGIAVYVTMAVASVTGMAWMGKKRED